MFFGFHLSEYNNTSTAFYATCKNIMFRPGTLFKFRPEQEQEARFLLFDRGSLFGYFPFPLFVIRPAPA